MQNLKPYSTELEGRRVRHHCTAQPELHRVVLELESVLVHQNSTEFRPVEWNWHVVKVWADTGLGESTEGEVLLTNILGCPWCYRVLAPREWCLKGEFETIQDEFREALELHTTKPDEGVVAFLVQLLAEARSGVLRGFAFVGYGTDQYKKGNVGNWADNYSMLGAVEMLRKEVLDTIQTYFKDIPPEEEQPKYRKVCDKCGGGDKGFLRATTYDLNGPWFCEKCMNKNGLHIAEPEEEQPKYVTVCSKCKSDSPYLRVRTPGDVKRGPWFCDECF